MRSSTCSASRNRSRATSYSARSPGVGLHHHHAAAAVDRDPVAAPRERGDAPTPTTAGTSSARATMAVCEVFAPVSVTNAATFRSWRRSAVSAGERSWATMIAPRRRLLHVRRLAEQVLDDPLADVVHVRAPLLEVLVGLLVERALDLARRALHRPLGVDALLPDEPLRLQDEHLVLQHHPVHVDDGGVLRAALRRRATAPPSRAPPRAAAPRSRARRGAARARPPPPRPEPALRRRGPPPLHRPAPPDGDAGATRRCRRGSRWRRASCLPEPALDHLRERGHRRARRRRPRRRP